jgi:subtilisin-like proprotein convertase family protein
MRKTLLLVFASMLVALATASSAAAESFVFTNSADLAVPDGGNATATLQSTTFGKVTKVVVSLTELSHTNPADLDIMIQAPTGEYIFLMSDACGSSDITSATWNFSDAAFSQMSTTALSCADPSERPSNVNSDINDGPDTWATAPGAAPGLSFSVLNGKRENGRWKLFARDDTPGLSGSIGGWSVQIETDGVGATRVPAVLSSGATEVVKAVSGFPRTITDVDVIVDQLTHTFPEDLDLVAISPSGTKVTLASDICHDQPWGDQTLTFDDESAAPAGYESACGAQTRFKPTDYGVPVTTLLNGVTGPFATALSAFDGQLANGVWRLELNDKVTGDYGYVQGFDLAITMRGAKLQKASNPAFKFKKSGKTKVKATGRVVLSGETLNASECAGSVKTTFANKVVKKKRKKKVTSYSKVVATNSPLTFAGTSCGFDITAKIPKKFAGKKLRLVTQYLGGELIAPFTTTSTEKIKKVSFK